MVPSKTASTREGNQLSSRTAQPQKPKNKISTISVKSCWCDAQPDYQHWSAIISLWGRLRNTPLFRTARLGWKELCAVHVGETYTIVTQTVIFQSGKNNVLIIPSLQRPIIQSFQLVATKCRLDVAIANSDGVHLDKPLYVFQFMWFLLQVLATDTPRVAWLSEDFVVSLFSCTYQLMLGMTNACHLYVCWYVHFTIYNIDIYTAQSVNI